MRKRASRGLKKKAARRSPVRRAGMATAAPGAATRAASVAELERAGNERLADGDWNAALRSYRAAARLLAGAAAGSTHLHFNAAYAFARLGRPFAAARSYRRHIDGAPRDADAWFNLGNAYREAGALHRAASAYETTLTLSPADHEAWNNLGNTRAALGQHAPAATAYRTALEIRSDYHPAWNNLGMALAALGEHEQAVACYDRAIGIEGGSVPLYFFNRAQALLAAGRTQEATADIGRWATLPPWTEEGARTGRGPDWLKFLQSLAPSRARREAR